ncbi:MAG: cytochrome c oxidase subunit II [Chitinophagales bacterium]|nr:cytochrome c oxidase subunit II [Chitinophagales bacterium]
MQLLLIALAIILVYVVIAHVGKAVELISLIKDEKQRREDSSRTQAFWFAASGVFLGLFIGITIFTEWHKFLTVPASEHGKWIQSLIVVSLVITGVVFVITNFLLFYFAWKYRYRKNRKALYYPENNKLEFIWTIVPTVTFIILIVMGVEKWFKVFSDAPTDAVQIEITGKQFAWHVRYGGPDNELGPRDFTLVNSSNELGVKWTDKSSRDDIIDDDDIVLPVNTPILINIGALDVIHSVYLPDFRLMMDAVPGVPTKFWFRPTITTEKMREIKNDPDFDYELACNQLCGTGHWNMRRVVKIVTEEEYKKWLSEQDSYFETNILAQN